MKQDDLRFSLVCRALVYQLCALLVLQPVHPAFAAGIAAATSHTTLNQAGNGVPIVDIAAPNGVGVSHNLYQDFNVGQAGVILNNATGPLTQTQLGGLIQNNPHLNGQSANLIINEVVGATPSQLQGYLEVAGQQAGVVVANPNGISCDGCGFINTPQVTLSTGKPVLDAQGQLQAIDVKQGTLTVGGNGLDATRQSSVDLVARAVQLNGALHGQTINVVAGANRLDRQTGKITAQVGSGAVPEVAIDTAALGGMYAGKIRLVSTEQGVGVNLANVVARQGDLTLDANGNIRLHDSAAQGQLTVNVHGNVELGGQLATQGALTTNATGDVTLSQGQVVADGVVLSGTQVAVSDSQVDARTVNLSAKESLNQSGEVNAAELLSLSGSTLTLDGHQQSGGGITITASQDATLQGELAATGPVTIKGGRRWVQDKDASLESQGHIDVTADEVSLSGRLQGQQIEINTQTLTNHASVTAGQTLMVRAKQATQQGVMHSQDQLNWHGGQLDNQGVLSAEGGGEYTITEFNNGQTGQLLSQDALTINTDRLMNQGQIVSERELTLTNQGELFNTGTLGGQQLIIKTDQMDSRGMLLGRDRISLMGNTLSSSGQLVSDGALNIGSQLLLLSGIARGLGVELTAKQLALDGTLQGEWVTLAADQILSGTQGELLSHSSLSVGAREMLQEGIWATKGEMVFKVDTLRNHGILASDATLQYQGQTLINGGTVSAHALTINTPQLRNSGLLLAEQAGQITAHSLDNQGRIQAGNDLTLSATDLLNSNQLIGGLALAITTETFTNSGTVAAGTTLALDGTSLTNHGKWVAGDVLHVTSDVVTQGRDGISASNNALLMEATALNGQGVFSARGPLVLKTHTLDINGLLHSDDTLTLNADTLTLSGSAYSKGELGLNATHTTLSGELTSQQDVTLQLDGLLRHDGRINANRIVMTADHIDGSGELYAETDLVAHASRIEQEGLWFTKQGLILSGDTLQLGGTLATLAGLTLNATSVLGSRDSAQVIAGTQLSVTGQTLQMHGRWQAGEDMHITAGQLTQPGDLLSGGGLRVQTEHWLTQGETQAEGAIKATLSGHAELGGRMSSHSDIHITANTLTQQGALLGQGSVTLTVHGMLQQLGRLMGQQALMLTADNLDQRGDVLAGSSVVDARIFNQQGQWLNHGQFSYQGQQFDNQGQLQANDLSLLVTQASNSGSVLAQNLLTLTGESLDNRGQWQAGIQILNLDELNNAQGAQLSSDIHGTLNVQQLSNAGQLVAQEVLNISGHSISNQGSGLISADTLTMMVAGTLSSAGILFGLRQLLVMSDTLEGHGQLLAGNTLGIDTGRVTRIGQWLSGGDLALHVGSDLISQGSISAKNRFELDIEGDWLHQGLWAAGQGLRATVAGSVDNQGALMSDGALLLEVGSLNNDGSLQAGSMLLLNTEGELRNSGMIASLGDQSWQGASLYNEGTFYSGGNLLLGANHELTNRYGTLLAEHGASLEVREGQLINASGTIEAGDGGLWLSAQDVINQRAILEIETTQESDDQPLPLELYLTSDDERLPEHQLSWAYAQFRPSNSHDWMAVVRFADEQDFKVQLAKQVQEVRESSAASAMLTSGDLTIHSGSLINDASTISAGHDITVHADHILNKSYALGSRTEYADYTYRYLNSFGYETTSGGEPESWRLRNIELYYTLAGTHQEQTDTGSLDALISAGGNLIGSVAGLIDNTTIKANAGPISSEAIRPELTDVSIDGPIEPGWQPGGSAQQVVFTPVDDPNGVPLPAYPVPGGGNGLFVVTDKPESQYLIEVNPLISELGSAGEGALSHIDNALAAAAQASGQWENWQTISTVSPGALPDGAMPTLEPDVEQNPILTEMGQFLGSSYFMSQLGYNPERDIKLLGDAAFDTRVIRDAVLAQTGQRFINGEMGSDLAQMRWLIDNAVQNQRELGLTPGVALTAAQVSQLGRSMVWWEPVWFNGQIVLAPKLYLIEADTRHLSGSVITAGNIDLKAGGINNSGSLLADGSLSLTSGSALINQGALLAGGDLSLSAMDDILNQGRISGQNVALTSSDGSIVNQTLSAQRHVDVSGILSNVLSDQTRFSRTDVGDTASITSVGNLLVQAGQDISLSAAELLAGGNMTLQANNDISIGSLEQRHTWEEGQNRFSRIDQLMSELDAGGNLSLSAGNDLSVVASTAEGKGDVSLSAGNNLVLASEANQTSDDVQQSKKHTIDRTTTQVGATVSGDNVSLSAGNHLMAEASTIVAQGNAILQAGSALQLTTANNEDYHYEKSKSGGTFSSKTTEIEQRDVMAQGTAITAGGNVSLASQGDMTLKGSTIEAGEALNVDTEGMLNLLTATDEHFYRKDEQKKGVTVKAQGHGESSTTERQNQLDGADINISAGQGVLLQAGQREGESLLARLDTLAAQPGMAWVEQVRTMPGVQMEAVQEAYEQWNYSQQSLNPIVASVIAIAVAAASGGAGAALLGTQSAVTTAMANAAFATLATQAAQSMVLHGGDLSAVLKDLGSSASIKQLATSVVTAGALSGFDELADMQSASTTANNPFAQPGSADLMSWDTFNRVTGHATLSAGINSTINGTNFGESFKDSLLANIQGQVGKSVAGVIGDNGDALGGVGKVVAHGVTSGAIAEITGGKFAAGAAGGAMSELASNWSLDSFGGNKEYQVALNKVLGGLAAVAVTGDENDFDTGADRAETVHRYNYLSHQQKEIREQDFASCQGEQLCIAQHGAKWDAINLLQETSFGAGMLAGIPAGVVDSVQGLVQLGLNPVQTLDALKSLINSDDLLGNVTDIVKQSYLARIEAAEAQYQKAGASGSFNAGLEYGKLLAEGASLVAGGVGVVKGGALLTEKITAKLVKEGVGEAVTAGSKVRAAVVNPTPAQLATAEKLGVDPRWVKSDGSPDWPTKANNGFDGGFDGPPKVAELQPGQTFDRYGGRFDEKGNFTDQGKFVAPEDVPFEQRSLPDSSLTSPYRKYEVIKPIPGVNAGDAAPWFGKPGKGTQYQLPMSIDELLKEGFIKPIK